jgi:hypothetical protein
VNNPDTAIIDEFAAAVAALAPHAPPTVVARLARATGNLLESLASRAASQSAGAFTVAYNELRGRIEALEQHNDATGRYSPD